MTALIIAGMLVILTGLGVLFLSAPWGVGLEWRDAPGGSLRYRLILQSRFASIVRALRKVPKGVNSAISFWSRVRVAGGFVNPEHLAHELGHLVRERDEGRIRHAVGYIGGGAEAEEAWAAAFGADHRDDPHMTTVARLRKGLPND